MGVGVPVGVGVGGGGEPAAMLTVSMTTVLRPPVLCEVTASPSSGAEPSPTVAVDLAMADQADPSADVYDAYVSPARVTRRYTGVVPGGLAIFVVLPPCAERTCTLIPAPGETRTEYSGAPGSTLARTIRPAFAYVLVLVCDATCALNVASPLTGCDTNLN